jgi:hypothetical protein
MPCIECRKQLNSQEKANSSKIFNLELCQAHSSRMERLVDQQQIPIEAVRLYYHLKSAGIQSMLAWWDGKQQIDLAISRVKLNISIDSQIHNALAVSQPLIQNPDPISTDPRGYSHLKIPGYQINSFPEETVSQIRALVEELRYLTKIA